MRNPARAGRILPARTTARVALVALVLAGATPAAAQSTTTTRVPTPISAGGRLVLASQDPWTPVGGNTRFGLDIGDAPSGGTISFSVGQAITGRKQYDAAAQGAPFGVPLNQVSVPLDLLEPDADGTRLVTVGLQSPTGATDRDRLNVRRPGVYPLDVELRDSDDQPIGSFRTMLVVAEADRATVGEPLNVAWVWPVTAPPSYLPNGEPDRDIIASFRPTGRLGRAALALDAADDVPVTLAPTAEAIEAWSEAARTDPTIQGTFAAFQRATSGRTVLGGSYVPVDLPALVQHGLGDAADDVANRGNQVLGPALGSPTDTRTRVARPASTASLGRLALGGVDRVVVESGDLVATSEPRLTPAQPVTLTATIAPTVTPPASALVTDPGLQSLLTADLPQAQRAQLVLAGLAMTALEAPNIARVVTLANPDDFDPPIELYEALLAGLRANPFLRPVTTTQAFDSVPVDPEERELANRTSVEPAVSGLEYLDQRARLGSFALLTRADDPAVAVADRALLASVSNGWPADIGRARADAHLGVVDKVIANLVAQIEVPDPRTITLTSRSGSIPLTFRNQTGSPIKLRASLVSEKLFFPEGSVLDLDLPPRSTTVRVAVEARTSGTFPLDLEVTSTDGVLSISQRRLQVRSTFVSTVGVVLMVSAVAFLALWWGIDWHRRRKRRRAPTAT